MSCQYCLQRHEVPKHEKRGAIRETTIVDDVHIVRLSKAYPVASCRTKLDLVGGIGSRQYVRRPPSTE